MQGPMLSCGGGHLGFLMLTKRDCSMIIHIQFGFNQVIIFEIGGSHEHALQPW